MKINLLYVTDKGDVESRFPVKIAKTLGKYCYYFSNSIAVSNSEEDVASAIGYLSVVGEYLVVVDKNQTVKQVLNKKNSQEFQSYKIVKLGNCKVCFVDDTQEGLDFIEKELVTELNAFTGKNFYNLTFGFVGVDKEALEDVLNQAVKVSENTLYYQIVEDGVDLKLQIIYDNKTPKAIVDKLNKSIIINFNKNIYAEEDVTLEQRLVDMAKLRRVVISTAESFTGGKISSTIISVPGASEIFYEGAITYNTNAKIQRLGVSEQTIKEEDVVSASVAGQMARGLLIQGNCQLAISTTGYSGPSSSAGLPVGLCYICIGMDDKYDIYRYKFDGDREGVMKTATKFAILHAIHAIKDI